MDFLRNSYGIDFHARRQTTVRTRGDFHWAMGILRMMSSKRFVCSITWDNLAVLVMILQASTQLLARDLSCKQGGIAGGDYII